MKKYAIKVTVDWESETVPVNHVFLEEWPEDENEKLPFWYKHVDCELVDIVPAHGVKGRTNLDLCLIVDDEGLLVNKKPNPVASLLYGYRIHGEPLVGTALIAKDAWTSEGLITDGLTLDECKVVLAMFEDLRKEFING